MTKKTEWQIQAEKEQAVIEKGLSSLTAEQLETIKDAHKTMGACLDMLTECHDLYLSDINKLNETYWKINHQFNLNK
jgi:hypothetical protein